MAPRPARPSRPHSQPYRRKSDPPRMSGIQLAPCELAGLVLESCLSGIALVMFFAATYVIVYKRGLSSSATTPFNKIIFTVTTVLFLCVMAVRRVQSSPPERQTLICYCSAALDNEHCARVRCVLVSRSGPGSQLYLWRLGGPKERHQDGYLHFRSHPR